MVGCGKNFLTEGQEHFQCTLGRSCRGSELPVLLWAGYLASQWGRGTGWAQKTPESCGHVGKLMT